jgi:GTP cyclohydrolase I
MMKEQHEFQPSFTGRSCDQMYLDESGYGDVCGLGPDHHIHKAHKEKSMTTDSGGFAGLDTGVEEYANKAVSPSSDRQLLAVHEGRTEADIDISIVEAAEYVLTSTTGLKTDDGHGDDTPIRFVKALRQLTSPEPFKFTSFPNEEGSDEMVLQQDIEFVSLCNHHIFPFMGRAHVAYIPGDRIVGLSKLARLVQYYAAGLQIQERLTIQIAERLEEELRPQGVAVILQAEHTCMTIRGVKAVGSWTTTSAMRGVFADHTRTAKAELMQLITSARQI